MKRQQCTHRPAMVSDPSGHSRRRLLHMGQTLMRRAKVIDCAYQEHPLVQRQSVTGQCPATARQRCEVFPKRRVEPLNVGRIDHSVPLRSATKRLHTCRRALDNAAFGLNHTPSLIALDDLGDQDMAPPRQPWPSTLARMHRIAKGLPDGPEVRHQAIGTDQQRTTCRTAPHPLDEPPDQGQVALLADLAAQPQARRDHQGQRHPDNAALFLDAQLIGLHLPQVPWLLDQILVHGLALTTRAGPPIRYSALIKAKRRHDGLHGAPMGQQGHDDDHSLGRGAQPIEDGPFAGAEGCVTRVADEALLLLRMDTNIALVGLASRMAVRIGAEYRCGVHNAPPGYAWNHCHEKYVWTPVCFTTSPHHGLMQSYPRSQSAAKLAK